MRASLHGLTPRMHVEPPKPGGNVASRDDGQAFEVGAEGVASALPGGKAGAGAGAAALSRFRFPPPLEAVEEEATEGAAEHPPASPPAAVAAAATLEPAADEGGPAEVRKEAELMSALMSTEPASMG